MQVNAIWACPASNGNKSPGMAMHRRAHFDPAAIAPAARAASPAGPKYTCPMHPQIVRDRPGSCPLCGMALEPVAPAAEEGESAELKDMTRRFWISTALTAPLLWALLGEAVPALDPMRLLGHTVAAWGEML